MKVTFFIARYSRSGVPLAQIRLAKLFMRRGYEVDFIVGYVPDGLELPTLDGINTLVLNRPRVLTMFSYIIKYLLPNKPDIIFSAEDHLNVIVLLAALVTRAQAKIVVSSRISAKRIYSGKLLSKNWFLEKLLLLVQNRADALVCVSKDMAKEYNSIFQTEKYQCIYNVVHDSDSERKMSENVDDQWVIDKSKPLIISAGTLTKRKGFKDLISAVKELTKTIDVKLLILGEGYLKEELWALVKKEKLDSVIRLAGYKENPLKYYSQADVFVLASYAEGLPNVLVEGMMCGCTPVSTDCPTGPREVLQDGKYGYLVPVHDPIAMAAGIMKALENPIPARRLAEGVIPFTEDEVFRKYESIFEL